MATASIDLIPAAYREECRARYVLKWFGVAFVLLLTVIGGTRYWLLQQHRAAEQQLETLRNDISYNNEQQQLFEALSVTRDKLDQHARVLDGLRGGMPAQRMFAAVDAAANGDAWFRKWTFRRQGEIVTTTEAVHSGYLIVLAPEVSGEQERAWRLDTHMEISGSALSHSAIAEFVDRLQQRPEISDARILRTGSRREASREIIDFELAVSVRAEESYTS